jgi:hypothetical protein
MRANDCINVGKFPFYFPMVPTQFISTNKAHGKKEKEAGKVPPMKGLQAALQDKSLPDSTAAICGFKSQGYFQARMCHQLRVP